MKICIISDLHANIEALLALPRDYDELWVLGDLVNYGPDPAATIDFVRSHAAVVVRGNHDHSIGFNSDCKCSPRFRAMAQETRDYTSSVLSVSDKEYLRNLPTFARRQVDDNVFFLCHATPTDPLYEYRPPDSPLWDQVEEISIGATAILVGHTHLQFVREAAGRMIVNPGSLGQSKVGDPRARYALWVNDRFDLKASEYPVQQTIAKVLSLPLSNQVRRDLSLVLSSGKVP